MSHFEDTCNSQVYAIHLICRPCPVKGRNYYVFCDIIGWNLNVFILMSCYFLLKLYMI